MFYAAVLFTTELYKSELWKKQKKTFSFGFLAVTSIPTCILRKCSAVPFQFLWAVIITHIWFVVNAKGIFHTNNNMTAK